MKPLFARPEPWMLGLAVLGLTSHAVPPLALINESNSLPRGLYVLDPSARPHIGQLVATPPDATAGAYLTHLGMPADALLLKRVAAGPGDRVCRVGAKIATPLGVVTAYALDRQGVSLPVWRDCLALGKDQVFLLGDSPNSFDSRYFGPVRLSAVTGVYREMVRW